MRTATSRRRSISSRPARVSSRSLGKYGASAPEPRCSSPATLFTRARTLARTSSDSPTSLRRTPSRTSSTFSSGAILLSQLLARSHRTHRRTEFAASRASTRRRRTLVYLSYMLSELRRRKGRTLLTALGLALGVGVVITVSALSAGLDRAQAQVLEPLTGVGTDMSVTRPIVISSASSSSSTNGGSAQLSAKERAQLQKENGDQRVGFGNLKAGEKFNRTSFRSTQLSFPASQVAKISALDGVSAAA